MHYYQSRSVPVLKLIIGVLGAQPLGEWVARNNVRAYDMSGNVSEYCYGKIDWRIQQNYTGELEVDPVRIDESGNNRPSYGGSWRAGAGSTIVHSFPANNDSFSTDSTGFRVVRSAK